MVTVVGSGCVEHVEAVWACSQHCAMPDTGRSVVPRCDAPIQEQMDAVLKGLQNETQCLYKYSHKYESRERINMVVVQTDGNFLLTKLHAIQTYREVEVNVHKHSNPALD